MTVPKCAPWTQVSITWEDCKIDPTGQHLDVKEALASYKPCVRKTLGHWVGVTERDGRVAVIVATEDDRNDASGFGGIIQVPLGMVMSIEVLQGSGKRKWVPEGSRKRKGGRVRLKASVPKTEDPQGPVGSNPTHSFVTEESELT